MILAAGMGTRLRPLTDSLPKCLMPLAGRPLLDWTLTWLRSCGVRECVMNLHYLPDMVMDFVGDGAQYGMMVQYSYEEELLGTAGAVKKVAGFFDGPFYMIYADNFSRWNLVELKRVCEENHAAVAMAVHWRNDVTQSGMVEMADDGRIMRLAEKPRAEDVTSHYVNAGFFYMQPEVLDYIPKDVYCDFSSDIFPIMLRAGEMIYAVKMAEPIIGIDTPDAYKEADALAKQMSEE
ncbi:MAG: nucleotidyltransferase family protein [Deltaproteobacteria bacterium]|nr:nucleotidyltransferase family protein [Deltaproteobacteria bacterium]